MIILSPQAGGILQRLASSGSSSSSSPGPSEEIPATRWSHDISSSSDSVTLTLSLRSEREQARIPSSTRLPERYLNLNMC